MRGNVLESLEEHEYIHMLSKVNKDDRQEIEL